MVVDAFAAGWLGIVPGALVVGLARAHSLDRITRLAVCAAFSPLLVSSAMAAGLAFGAPPAATAWSLVIATGPIALLGGWRSAGESTPPRSTLFAAAGIAIALPALWVALLWWVQPEYRLFGRHNLMHSDLIYQLVRAPWPPEEPELAGLALGYGWFGHGLNAAVGLVSDHPPTRFFPWLNLVSLSATAVLLARAGRELGASAAVSALAASLAFLSFHASLEAAFWFGSPEDGSRLIAPITKFLFLDLMPASMPLIAVVVWAGVRQDAVARVLGSCALLALAASYVAAVPAALCTFAGLSVARLAHDRRFSQRTVHLALLAGLAVAALGMGMAWTPSGPDAPGLMLTPAIGIQEKGLDALLGFGPWWLLGLPASWQAWRRGRPELAGLMLAGAVLAAAYPLLLARNLEYKLVIYARILIAPAVALTLLAWAPRRHAWALAAVITMAVGAASVPRALFRVDHAIAGSVRLDERAFHLRWDDPAEAAWVESIRRETNPETLLITQRCTVMLGALADRSLYAPCAEDGRDIAGYTLWVPANLWLFRGQPQAVLNGRRETLGRLYRAIEPEPFWQAIETIQALDRPLALHFSATDRLKPRWLRTRGVGHEIHRDDQHAVWWLPAGNSIAGLDPGR